MTSGSQDQVFYDGWILYKKGEKEERHAFDQGKQAKKSEFSRYRDQGWQTLEGYYVDDPMVG